MDYQFIYDRFIADRREREPKLIASGDYSERHHITPRALGGSDDPANVITLTPDDHFFAHLCLAKTHGGSMWVAICYMTGIDKKQGRASRIAGRSMYAYASKNAADNRRVWTRQMCLDEARKHNSSKEWDEACSKSYSAAQKLKIVDECRAHMTGGNRKFDLAACMKSAAPHNWVRDWARADKTAYDRARKNRWMSQCTAHMTGCIDYAPSNKGDCFERALVFSTRGEWARGDAQSYKSARRYGWVDEILEMQKGVSYASN